MTKNVAVYLARGNIELYNVALMCYAILIKNNINGVFKMDGRNPRINVTFEESTAGLLSALAEYEHKSLSNIVRDLTLEALELREDLYLSKIEKSNEKLLSFDFSLIMLTIL